MVASEAITESKAVKVSSSSVVKIEEVLSKKKHETIPDQGANVRVKEALRTRGDEAKRVINKELQQMLDRKVWVPVTSDRLPHKERQGIIGSSMFLKMKTHPDDKYKARLVASGNQQNKGLYDVLSSPTASTSEVFTVMAIAAHERRHSGVVDIGGAFLHTDMTTGVKVHMRLHCST